MSQGESEQPQVDRTGKIRGSWEKTVVATPEDAEAVSHLMREASGQGEMVDAQVADAQARQASQLEKTRTALKRGKRTGAPAERTVVEPVPAGAGAEGTRLVPGRKGRGKEVAVQKGPFVAEHAVTSEAGEPVIVREFASTRGAYEHYVGQLRDLNALSWGDKIRNWGEIRKERETLRESLAILRAKLIQEGADEVQIAALEAAEGKNKAG